MSRAMKDSGVPWLKEIPVDWKVERGKNVLALQKRPVRDNDEVVTCFRDGEVILRSLRRTEGFTMSDKEIGYQGINEGDIVIHGMDGFAGAMGVSKSTGKGSPVLIVCTPKYDAIPQYIIYYLRALAMTDVFVALATGIRERSCDLRWNKVSELEFIMPSSSEQQAIVEFLDRKCAEVDEMIALQEQIIEELRAYKQSVITEAVTKGLNPAAPMRDSGIEWIGQIPEHWEMTPFRSYVVMRGEKNKGEKTRELLALSFALGVTLYRDKVFNMDRVKENYEDYQLVYENDLVLSPNDIIKGSVYVSKYYGCISPMYLVFSARNKNTHHLPYLSYLLRTKEAGRKFFYIARGLIGDILDNGKYVTRRMSVSKQDLMSFKVLLPPITEQRAIADYLDEKCADIDSLIQTKQSKIDSLKEYKKSIIYEYVTGKREVE